MKLIWSKSAMADRRAIFNRIERDNPAAALDLDAAISWQANLLLAQPRLGRTGRRPGTRELVFHPNYLLVYSPKTDHIQILRVLHAARRWP